MIGDKEERIQMPYGRDMRVSDLQDKLWSYNVACDEYEDELQKYIEKNNLRNCMIDISKNKYLSELNEYMRIQFQRLLKAAKEFAEKEGRLF